MSLQQGIYLIKAAADIPPPKFATAGGANDTVHLFPQGSEGQIWLLKSVGDERFIVESNEPNSPDKLSLSYPSNLHDGGPITTENRQSPLVWIIRGTQQPNQFIISPDTRMVGTDICAAVQNDEMVIQVFPLEESYRPTWEFIRIFLD